MSRKFVNIICACLLVAMLLVALHVMKHHEMKHYTDVWLKSLAGPIEYDDPFLIQYISKEILLPPSSLPLHLAGNIANKIRHPSEVFYARNVRQIFNRTEKGFFVEAGALDGESMSNTLWLEKHRGWTGLLVEPDPSNFLALKSKHRRAWLANVCLSIEKFPKVEILTSVDTKGDIKARSMGSIIRKDDKEHIYNSYYNSQCFPLGSLLLATNVTRIDLLSLDVESVEDIILRNFDFEKFDVQVLFIEHHNYQTKRHLSDFLESKGYEFVANKGPDLIYCKSGTELAKSLLTLYPNRIFYDIYVIPDNTTKE